MSYHESRLTPDAKRNVVWQALWRFHFNRIISADDCVLDLGTGYGNFINNVQAKRRIALDTWPEFPRYLAPGVEAVVGPVTDLDFLADGSVDFAFASNLFEHIPQDAFARVLDGLRPKLSGRGSLNILQPNYRYAVREYFDDYTHVAIYSHISLADFLTANGYQVTLVVPRFLPLTVKSRMPVSPWLIAAYLASPIKPLGKQMFLRAVPRR
ncbi:class I SAM-dependent methyltransferase [Acidisphaera sp. S103]|uniref:class I SAM-dependent methyltransferase n=1 Tax=Acidisphaera sp. S103 TaxID=1747223 RepID=UPI00131B1AFB|nr:class I SAM-dependent methyltransferase [Acidisphaera sp. S103]